MYLITIMLWTLVSAIIHYRLSVNGHPYDKKIDDLSNKLRSTSLFDDKTQIVTLDDSANTFTNDNDNFDNNDENAREYPDTSWEAPYQRLFTDYGSSYSLNESDNEEPECILARSEFYLSWWVHENGSLRLPAFNRLNTSGILDLSLQFESESSIFNQVLNFTSDNPNDVIRFMSVANNKLYEIPASVLNLTSATIQYLSLAGNNFYDAFEYGNTTFQEFTSFPLMSQLLELDLRNCQITNLGSQYFVNLPKLDKLFLSNNHFIMLQPSIFAPLTSLRHLDLSYNQIVGEIAKRIDGLILHDSLFTNLTSLMFLDLSYTKLSRRSVRAFRSLGPEMKQLSLCHTGITEFEEDMLRNTTLNVIDLSGNTNLANNLKPQDFEGFSDSLEIFVFRDAKIKNFNLISSLRKLRLLDFRNNDLTYLWKKDFEKLNDLEILDLGSNHINNWYEQVFTENKKLRILNLRSNNITFIWQGMINDFYEIRYLAIGSNEFICACNLRDFIDRATRNALYRYCSKRSKRSIDESMIAPWKKPEYQYNVFLRELHTIVAFYEESYRNMIASAVTPIINQSPYNNSTNIQRNIGLLEISEKDCYDFDSEEATHMNFNFLLLDYHESEYECIDKYLDYSTPRRMHFREVESCFSYETDSTEPYDGSSDDESNEEPTDDPESTTASIIIPTTTEGPFYKPLITAFDMAYLYFLLTIPLSLLFALWFWKRADIKYFCTLFRNSLILSLDKEDKKTLMLTSRKKSMNSKIVDEYQYDVFVSYSDKDRSWVLDELIPNVEKRDEINICLHERDFQVGLSILENIIQCMDKSRCLLLVVSESFLKSNWCSFEMHLAQHRLIETRREQLILVLLQDIPRSRRSRTLQFLMRTKTYIMWPSDDKEESKLNFWKRLRKAIVLNNWEPENKINKPRHSIV